ncbi:MAG TPA: T9SS type A sorting domain-containing protein [Bacteroidales bacterium]|nr:T9SS type A sorting domain-containing protein [Bacteroidales bacterium]
MIVCNSFGEIIIREKNIKTIDLSHYANGIYYLTVKTGNADIITRKIVLIK